MHHKRKKINRRETGNWREPKYYKKDKENLNRSKKRKRACKATKGGHDYQIINFKIVNHKRFSKRNYPSGYKYFSLGIVFRCPCGKKSGNNINSWYFLYNNT